jgi:hypothetical protein
MVLRTVRRPPVVDAPAARVPNAVDRAVLHGDSIGSLVALDAEAISIEDHGVPDGDLLVPVTGKPDSGDVHAHRRIVEIVNEKVLQENARSRVQDAHRRVCCSSPQAHELEPLDGDEGIAHQDLPQRVLRVDHDPRASDSQVPVARVSGEDDVVRSVGNGSVDDDVGGKGERRVVVDDAHLAAVVGDEARARDGKERAGPSVDARFPRLHRRELAGKGIGLSRAGRAGEGRGQRETGLGIDALDDVVDSVDEDAIAPAPVDGDPRRSCAGHDRGPIRRGDRSGGVVRRGPDRPQVHGRREIVGSDVPGGLAELVVDVVDEERAEVEGGGGGGARSLDVQVLVSCGGVDEEDARDGNGVEASSAGTVPGVGGEGTRKRSRIVGKVVAARRVEPWDVEAGGGVVNDVVGEGEPRDVRRGDEREVGAGGGVEGVVEEA